MPRGQASTEYVAMLALVAVVLAAAATVVAAPGLPAGVVHGIRTGLCIVGGDICRAADARARGLEPCVNSAVEHSADTSVSLLVVRTGHEHAYAVERLSDGRVRVRGTDGGHTSGSSSRGFQLGVVLDAQATSGGAISFQRGREWTFDDGARAAAFLKRVDDPMRLTDDMDVHRATHLRAPVRYLEGGGEIAGDLTGDYEDEVLKLHLPGLHSAVRGALGRRVGPDGTTVYFDASSEVSGTLASIVPGLGSSDHVVAEWHDADPPEFTLRTLGSATASRSVETAVRLPLTHPGDRAAALKMAVAELTGPEGGLLARDFANRVRERGTVEQLTYDQEDVAATLDATVAAPFVSAGFDHVEHVSTRHLVDAKVVAGGATARRLDCLGLDAG